MLLTENNIQNLSKSKLHKIKSDFEKYYIKFKMSKHELQPSKLIIDFFR